MRKVGVTLVVSGFLIIALGYVLYTYAQVGSAEYFLPLVGIVVVMIGIFVAPYTRRW